jgi:voltage-gated potassium channel
MNKHATLIAAVREAENADLLQQSGADSVVISSEAAGRLLGLASTSPAIGEVMQDLLVQGSGLDIGERPPSAAEVGRSVADLDGVVLGVVRDGTLHLPDDAAIGPVRADDQLVVVGVSGIHGGL